jgi:acyl-CoA synthetase (NDP forming)
VELLKDVAVRLTPLTAGEADRMLHELTTFPLLDGYRGHPRADVGALKRLLLGVSALAEDLPDVAELDINPVIVTTAAAVAVDARIRVEAREPRPPEGSRTRPPSADRGLARQ